MAADLVVALDGSGAVLEVHAADDGVLAEAVADVEEGILHLALAGELGLLGLVAAVALLVVGEEGHLLEFRLGSGLFDGDEVLDGDAEAAHQEGGVDDAVVKFGGGLEDEFGRGGASAEILRAVGALGDFAAVAVGDDLEVAGCGVCRGGEVAGRGACRGGEVVGRGSRCAAASGSGRSA